ncbi:MAG: hypothetical protein KAW91_03665 [candidate division Zixibacteria bacterium]|nr:hypothetical protein [candidate division Zixibacteria bacterium]
MHPPREKLKLFVEGRLGGDESDQVTAHVETCEFCREFCDNYSALLESTRAVSREELPRSALKLADKLYWQALSGKIVPLSPLGGNAAAPDMLLAADGPAERSLRVQNLATHYCEDPEIVLRVMRDPELEQDYLQLISDDTGLVSGVLVQLPQLGREFVTDESGHATLGERSPQNWDELKWQVKMPDAVFDLEPLAYDPEAVQCSTDSILETDAGDRIQVTLEGRAESKQITIRVLGVDGASDFDAVRVVVSQENNRQLKQVGPSQSVAFELIDPHSAINIRLFQ